jgi:hypothetical protein
MALWKHEEAILDMVDGGMSKADVAARGYTPAQIDRVINTIGTAEHHERNEQRRNASVRKGTVELLRAIQRAQA